MTLLSEKEALNVKLSCIPVPQLKIFAAAIGVQPSGTGPEIIKRLVETKLDNNLLDGFIKRSYLDKVTLRRKTISDASLLQELTKVTEFSWGTVQGIIDYS